MIAFTPCSIGGSYFVAYVVYHEMLHHMIPAARGTSRHVSAKILARPACPIPTSSSRRTLHPPEFLERERAFRQFERALDCRRRHISRLLADALNEPEGRSAGRFTGRACGFIVTSGEDIAGAARAFAPVVKVSRLPALRSSRARQRVQEEEPKAPIRREQRQPD